MLQGYRNKRRSAIGGYPDSIHSVRDFLSLTPFGHPTGMPQPVCGRAILLWRLARSKVIVGTN